MKRWVIAAAVIIAAAPVHAQMVKCVDKDGVTHYTDRPPPGCKGAEANIRSAPPISGKVQESKENVSDAERDFQRRRIEKERKENSDAKKLEAQKRRCASLHADYQNLSSGRRIVRTNEKGEREAVDQAVVDRRVAQLKGEIEQNCRF